MEQPWSLAFLPDGRMLVTEKAGRLRVVSQGKLLAPTGSRSSGVTVHGQGGLHDVVLHPEFEKNQLVYLAYAARGGDGVGTELARGRLAGKRLEDVEVLFRQAPKGPRASTSAGASCSTARLPLSHARRPRRARARAAPRRPRRFGDPLHDDGRVPKDNPFVGRRLEAGEVHARQPQHAGRGAASADRRAVDARARAAGRRRGQRDPRRAPTTAGR